MRRVVIRDCPQENGVSEAALIDDLERSEVLPRRATPSAAEVMYLRHVMGLPATRGLESHPELECTNRIMRRWAVSQGSGLPSDSWDDDPKAQEPPLDDEMAIKVDRIVQHDLVPKYHTLAVSWYKSQAPREVIARKMGLPGRSSLYPEWRAMLSYLRGRFQGVGIDC
jgi:hypothetical protein